MTIQVEAAVLQKPQLEEQLLPEQSLQIIHTEQYIQADKEDEPRKMATGLHGGISSVINAALVVYTRPTKLGRVFDSSTTYNFKDGLPKRMPDISFVSQEKMPKLLDEEITVAPDLVVEVVSKNDLVVEVEAKVKQYQQAGVKLVWIVYPFSQTVEVYRLNNKPKAQLFDDDYELDGGEVLPGFKLQLKTIFE